MSSAKETVVLLHGLARKPGSMAKLGSALEEEGYRVVNIGYPSRHYTVEVLAEKVRKQIVAEVDKEQPVHFVTHSLGGILIRQIQAVDPLPNLSRVVMLSPPNQGSEIVDKLGDMKAYYWINGPAGLQLGTGAEGFIAQLPKIDFECGVLTGDRSINLVLSTLIPGPDDGKVSVVRAQTEGATDFKVLHATHTFIMKNDEAIQNTLHFLKVGRFP